MNILLIDDELLFLTPITHYLKKSDYNVTECESPLKAVQLVETYKFDCIIIDYSMPEMNGIEFVKWIRHHSIDIIKDTPVLLLTGWEEIEIVKQAYDEGISLFRTKADILRNPQGILQAISTAIAMNETHRVTDKIAIAFKKDI